MHGRSLSRLYATRPTSCAVVPDSFLRRADPRTKLALSILASLAVMLPLPRLVVFVSAYAVLVLAAGLVRQVGEQVWRIRLLLLVLFALDWVFIGAGFAVLITLRLVLLVTSFTLLFATTTPEEMRQAIERLGVPPRFAFVFATTYRSLELVRSEWLGIIEAQRARGITLQETREWSWTAWRARLAWAVSLIVPAVVLVAQRAWSITEAAAVRGFDSPRRLPARSLRLARVDHVLLAATAGLFAGLYIWQ